MSCPICGRDKQDEFCSYHQTAFDNVKEMYAKWETAAGDKCILTICTVSAVTFLKYFDHFRFSCAELTL